MDGYMSSETESQSLSNLHEAARLGGVQAQIELAQLLAELDKVKYALRQQILIYRVSDYTWDKEAEVDRLMVLTLDEYR